MIASLLLRIVQSYATQTAARGTGLMTMDTLDMMLVAVLVFLVLRQVMPIAAGLAGGLSLNSFGMLSRTVMMAMPRRKAERVRGEVSSSVQRTPRSMVRTAGAAVPAALKPGDAARDGASTGLESRDHRWQTFRP
jgi:type IV secretion system protein VirB6